MDDILKILAIDEVNCGVCSSRGWDDDISQPVLESFDPTTNISLSCVRTCSETQYESAIELATKAFQKWRNVPAPKRGELVRRIGDELRRNKSALGSLVTMETGKIKSEGDGEVQEMIDIADFAVGQSRMLYGRTMHSERPNHRLYEQWHPLGAVGVITAFNFPVAVWAWNALIAAVAGNVVIWKPSPKTSLCAIAVQHLCNRVMEESGHHGVFSLFVSDTPKLIEKFVRDRRVPLISFTGSTVIGRQVGTWVAERLGRSLLELSGNNAVIVDRNADLDLAIPAIVFAAVGTAGQRCTTIRRVIIHQDIYDAVVARLISAYRQVPIGNPMDSNTLMGPLIDQSAVEKYRQVIDELIGNGAKIRYGGNVIRRTGHFVEPTLVEAENDWEIVQQETFAPILYMMKFEIFDQAIAMQNNSTLGLSSALFSNDLCHCEQFLSAVGSDCGIANINIGTSGAEIGGAFGGEKDTGGGREAGSDAWKAYMRRQTNTINWGNKLALAQDIEFEIKSS